MSFPWTINRFISTNINNSNSITGTYESVSFKVNGNTELAADATIQRLGVGKAVNSSYVMDASGNINVNGNYYQNGTIFSPTGLLTSNNIWSGTNQFNTTFPSSTLPVTSPYTTNSFLPKKIIDALYASLGTDNIFSGVQTFQGNIDMTYSSGSLIINFGLNPPYMLGTNITGIPDGALSSNVGLKNAGSSLTPQNWSGYNSFNNNLPTSSLASGTTTTATQFLTRQMNDTRYGQLTSGVTNNWTSTTNNFGTTTFNVLPTCNDLVTIPGNFTIMNKQQSAGYWPDKSAGVTNTYGSTNSFNGNTNFNVNLPQSSLAASTTTSATQFLTRQMNDLRYGQILTGVTNTWASTQIFSILPTSTDTTTTPVADSLIRKAYADATYQSSGSYGTLAGSNAWSGNTNTFNSYLPTSSLTPTQASTTATQFLTRQINDARYGQILTGTTNTWASTQIFSVLPTSTDTTTTPVANSLIRKAYADVTYPVILNSINSLYGGSGAFNNGTSTANYCIALGTSALASTTGGFNQAYGTQALQFCTSGAFNMAFGVNSLRALTTGSSNMAIGTNSLPAGNCSNSVGIGQSAFQNNTASPGQNTGIGANVMNNSVGSSNCTAIGYNAGTVGIVNGSNNTFIGTSTSASGDYSNSTAIGYSAQITGNNQIVLGRSTETTIIGGACSISGGITASAAQTINFGTNAPTMSGLNIISTTIPTAALQSNVTLNDTASTFLLTKTFTGGITASASQTITFGTNPITVGSIVSGGYTVTQAQIGYLSSVSTGIVDTASNQSITGDKTFSGNVIVNSVILMKDQGTLITSATTAAPLYTSYSVQAGSSAFTITLPTITSTNVGQRLLFRRTGGTTTTVVSFIGNGSQNVYNTALTGGTTAQSLMGSGVYKVELISCLLTASTYAWFQI